MTKTGEQADDNANRGLYYLRARHYDPALGRFLSKDPLAVDPYGTAHGFVYASDNPVNRIDPLGLDDEPMPIPLPVPGSSDNIDRCQKGFVRCIENTAPTQRDLRNNELKRMGRKKLYPLTLFNDVCTSVLRQCLHAATADQDVEFDFEMAESLMRGIGRGSGLRLSFPVTGSGGHLARSKEGVGVCPPWSWRW
jgi:RHS repeat-associated protein